ncbi:unnamed protein product [Staurois parvus]|uniref:NADH-ubiquinone oxidoreductase chain 4L n=1 Tax=Staurois parvus TaxID=386267 RepID=A0ABN9AHU3_9NEOB|nr:unnamed protein product [Staurois parvus]
MNILLVLIFFIIFMGFSFHRTHLLSLLCLEGIILVIFIGLSLWPNQLTYSSFVAPLILLTMSACEAGLGLSLIVATSRSHGSDNLKKLSVSSSASYYPCLNFNISLCFLNSE